MLDPSASRFIPRRTVALIGMMAAGKSTVGAMLAEQMKLSFADVDRVMEKESGLSITDYFGRFGEGKFRIFERETVAKILAGPPCVAALGGGAFMNADTRALLKRRAVTVWLKADKRLLLERASLTPGGRPLLQGDPAARMTALLAEREPIYAEADIVIESDNGPVEATVARVLKALEGCARTAEAAS